MRKIREVFRLKFEGAKHSDEKIAQIMGLGETTVREYLNRAKATGLTWPLPEDFCDKKLEEVLYPPKLEKHLKETDLPNFEYIHNEFKKKGVTLSLLWQEYKESQSNYCCYSLFCRLYKEWCNTGDTWMMQIHKSGDITFIDWAGHTFPIYNPKDGTIDFEAQIFVSVLGASSYIFCEGFKSQKISDWGLAHKRMGDFYEGVTEYWVPDNTKSAVIKSNRYESDFQSSYEAMARHHKVAILPARVRRPQDKSKVESSVYLVENQVLAPLRNQKFFSLEEFNLAARPLLITVNNEPFQKMPGSSRYSLYLELDRPALNPLPAVPYENFYYGRETLNKGYHIFIEGVPYSVPYRLIGKSIESRHNERTVEFFYNSKQVAIHVRSLELGIPVTNPNHQPVKHQRHAESTNPENIKEEAVKMGEFVLSWVSHVLEDPSVKERQRLNTALGVVRLSKTYSFARVNAACARGLFYNNFLFKGIEDILKRKLDSSPLPNKEVLKPLPQNHGNLRGANYYI